MISISLFLSKIPFTPKRLPEDEQMLETRKEGVTEMTSFQAGTYSWLEQIQNFVSSGNPPSGNTCFYCLCDVHHLFCIIRFKNL